MGDTVVVSVRVPKDVVKRLKKRGISPSEVARKAILLAGMQDLVEDLNKVGKRVRLPPIVELKKITREGLP